MINFDEDCYSTGVFTRLADENIVCQHCVDKLMEDEDMTPEAARKELAGKLTAQNVYRVGNSFLCKDCVGEIYDNMYADEEAVGALTDEEIEAELEKLDENEQVEAEE